MQISSRQTPRVTRDRRINRNGTVIYTHCRPSVDTKWEDTIYIGGAAEHRDATSQQLGIMRGTTAPLGTLLHNEEVFDAI